jgi:Ca-activated chloride channel family protein
MNQKRLTLLIILLITSVILAACGGSIESAAEQDLALEAPATQVYTEVAVEAEESMAAEGLVPPNGEPVADMFFEDYGVNPFIDSEDDNLSTFAIDVDTGSYTIMRRYLRDGNLPPDESVRVEEYVNYFEQAYARPQNGAFAIHLEGCGRSGG